MENNVTEIMENVTEAIVENDAVMPSVQEVADVQSGNAWIKPLIVAGAIVCAVAVVKRDKIAAKITAKRIKWLEKHGYTVIKNEDIVDETIDNCDEDVVD